MLVDSGRQLLADKKFDSNESDVRFINYLFVRVIARKRTFKNVNFRYTIFDRCYLRDCAFDSCDFTGCQFVGTNLHGSRFSGCIFDYATFERTSVDSAILDTECPGYENLKARFARTLRVNYQQLGDAAGANKAIKVELQATELHLHKAWKSNERYYRQKYSGWWPRVKSCAQWSEFKILDFIWGNGESLLKLCRFVLIVLGVMVLIHVLAYGNPWRLDAYLHAFAIEMPATFLGVFAPEHYPKWYLSLITLVRLVAIGFLLSIIIKRFNRR